MKFGGKKQTKDQRKGMHNNQQVNDEEVEKKHEFSKKVAAARWAKMNLTPRRHIDPLEIRHVQLRLLVFLLLSNVCRSFLLIKIS